MKKCRNENERMGETWAASRPEVRRIGAETDPDNSASQRVLEKCGFVPTGEYGEEGPRSVWNG